MIEVKGSSGGAKVKSRMVFFDLYTVKCFPNYDFFQT